MKGREHERTKRKRRGGEEEEGRGGTPLAVLFNCLSDTQSPWLPSGCINQGMCVCVCVCVCARVCVIVQKRAGESERGL